MGVARRLDVGPGRPRPQDDAEAQGAFNAVYGQVPGELAPKLALAFACETGGDTDVAESLYVTCARTDANYIAPAAFGLARIRAGAATSRARSAPSTWCPATSRAFTEARRRRAGCSPSRVAGCRRWRPPSTASRASPSTPSTGPGSGSRCSVARSGLVETHGADPTVVIAGRPAAEPGLRDGLEAAYRDLAGYASSRDERSHLVDQANAVRRWTLR